ncbi:hypothetical protein Dvina_00985 [Dactylosporangium vinaceum]|uniref:Type VII secretion protein EccE n=1 Tax=Dactylosporangium vinaceum TaxID=53362 RepID=A0ABV5MMR1_9ACTN|nr:hypothetical protein [Dactylosporangium vinaceum]UAB96841.1 hypothetical protein Dvina_00985 [Dactylosporangium vinaceum]
MRIVLAQAALALAAIAWAAGGLWPYAGLPLALVMLISGVLRPGPRSTASLPTGTGNGQLLALVRPDVSVSAIAVDEADMGTLEDADGLVALIRVGDVSALLGAAPAPLPPLRALLPPPAPDLPEVCVQLLISTAAAPTTPATAPSAESYRQLTNGRLFAHQRVHIAVRVRRAGGFRRADLAETLLLAVRRISRLVIGAGLAARPLAAQPALTALGEAAQHDPDHPVRATGSGLEVGGRRQAVFRIQVGPELGQLFEWLPMLPAAASTVSLTAQFAGRTKDAHRVRSAAPPAFAEADLGLASASAGGTVASDLSGSAGGGSTAVVERPPVRAELTVRLAAVDEATLAQSVTALQRLAEAAGAQVVPFEGPRLDGLAATLPLGGGAPRDAAVLAGLVAGRDGPSVGGDRLAAATPVVGGDGVMLGVNRHGQPLVVRLFRPEPTRVAVIGGLRCAQMVVLRALAVGGRVLVQSSRPYAWEPLLRALGSVESLGLIPAGRVPEPPPATAMSPQLLVVDVGPVPGRVAPVPESPWRTLLFLRDELTPTDTDLLTRADLTVLQPLTPPVATLAADTLGLGESREWLIHIETAMVAVIANRQTVRWTHLATTPLEHQLIGGPARARPRTRRPRRSQGEMG